MTMQAGQSGYGMSGNKVPKGYDTSQIQQFTPEQMKLFKQMFGNVSPDSYLSKLAGGDQGIFQQMEAPALRQFNELQGGLASRFSGMGMGARRSSGFQNTTNQAASDFAQQLQANRQSLQQQAIKDLHSMSSDLLNQRPYEQQLVEKQHKPNPWATAAGAALGGAAGFFVGGPPGAVAGAGAGYQAGSQF